MIVHADKNQSYWALVFSDAQSGTSLDVRDNIFQVLADTAGGTPTNLNLLGQNGDAYFGTNWISQGWVLNGDQPMSAISHVGGTGNFISNAQNNPGLMNTSLAAPDFHLTSLSQVIDQEQVLPANVLPVLYEIGGGGIIPRTLVGAAADLGAYEYGD